MKSESSRVRELAQALADRATEYGLPEDVRSLIDDLEKEAGLAERGVANVRMVLGAVLDRREVSGSSDVNLGILVGQLAGASREARSEADALRQELNVVKGIGWEIDQDREKWWKENVRLRKDLAFRSSNWTLWPRRSRLRS